MDSPAATSEQAWDRVATFAEVPKCKNQELSFRALLTEAGTERLELAKV